MVFNQVARLRDSVIAINLGRKSINYVACLTISEQGLNDWSNTFRLEMFRQDESTETESVSFVRIVKLIECQWSNELGDPRSHGLRQRSDTAVVNNDSTAGQHILEIDIVNMQEPVLRAFDPAIYTANEQPGQGERIAYFFCLEKQGSGIHYSCAAGKYQGAALRIDKIVHRFAGALIPVTE